MPNKKYDMLNSTNIPGSGTDLFQRWFLYRYQPGKTWTWFLINKCH